MDQKVIGEFNRVINSDKYFIFHYSCSDISKFPISIGSISLFNANAPGERKFSRTEFTEREVILNFLNYIKEKVEGGFSIIGWNINKEIYGLQPIMRRFKEITGKDHPSVESKKQVFDLDEIIKSLFPNFKGGLHNILLFNSINLDMFLFGEQEINFLKENDFQNLDNSTMKKVRSIGKLIQLYKSKKLLIQPRSFWQKVRIIFQLKTRKIREFLKKYTIEILISIIAAVIVQIAYWLITGTI